jgi:hypothetical protein
MTLIPAPFVDALPERFWWLGNLVLGIRHLLHLFIGGDGCRTVEFDGREVGRGRKPLVDSIQLSGDVLDRVWRLDFGWIALLSLIIAIPVFAVRRRVASGRYLG